jgi:hypothetical protein
MYAKNMSEDEAIEWLEGVLTGSVEVPTVVKRAPAKAGAVTAAKSVSKPPAKPAGATNSKPSASKTTTAKPAAKKTPAAA